jgi:hypothetical protein
MSGIGEATQALSGYLQTLAWSNILPKSGRIQLRWHLACTTAAGFTCAGDGKTGRFS